MKKRYVIFLILAMILTITMIPTIANAALTVHTFPDENNVADIRARNRVQLGSDTLKRSEWHGVSGEIIYDDAFGISSQPHMGFWVPVNGTTDYTDLLDLYFENVCTTPDGRALNAQLHVNSFHSENYGSYAPSKVPVGFIYTASQRFSAVGYQNGVKVDFTLTITYADTGEVYEKPMLHIIGDVDIVRSTMPAYNESWELKSGYTGDIWKWSSFNESISGNKITATDGTNYEGNDSFLKAGAVATTNNGEFRFTAITTHKAGTLLEVSLANDNLPEPIKESDGKDINLEGDTINYTVSQQIGTFYADTMCQYSSFKMEDTLPKGVVYKSAKVYDGTGKDITSQGTIQYNATTRKVTFTMGSSWLSNLNNYNGQTIVMKIVTTVDKPTLPMSTITNVAKTYIDDVGVSTNEVEDVVAIPYHVNYEYVSGTAGKTLPAAISTTKGAYMISDSGTYYQGDTVARKDSPADDTVHEVKDSEGNYIGKWILTWDAKAKTVDDSDVVFTGTWRYVPAPRLIIIKKLADDEEQFTLVHGEPTFIFKVTGKESGKVWYKSLTFSSAMVNEVRNNTTYSSDNGEIFSLKDGYIYGECQVYLPEDDYVVEEVDSIRFDEISCTAYYHNDNGSNLISTSKGSITVPLKLSTYKSGNLGFDADYAGVCYENSKVDWSKYSHTDKIINKLID